MKFKAGDRVRILKNKGCGLEGNKPEYLVITSVKGSYYDYDGYDENDRKIGTCCACHDDDSLEYYSITKKQPIMTSITNMMKKLLDKDTQTLVKAGYINGDLLLTEEGKQALLEINFDSNKVALVALAQSKIDEEEANKDK